MADDHRHKGFHKSELPKTGLLDRMRGRAPREAAFVEIRNRLATGAFAEVSKTEIGAILQKSRLTSRDAASELKAIYEHAVCFLAADGVLDARDCAGLANLQDAFELSNDEASAAIEGAVGSVFQHRMREALAKGNFSPEDRARLEQTGTALGMAREHMDRVYAEAAVAAVQGAFDAAVIDRRYTAVEERQVQALAASLGVTIAHDEQTRVLVERFRTLAQIADGHLPSRAVPLILQRGETCHFAASGLAHKELRTVTKRVNYAGLTSNVRIVKGLHLRAGTMSVQRITQDVLTPVDVVDFYITNKKLLLQGIRKNSSIALNKVVRFEAFSDGLKIDKQTGKDLYLVGTADWEMAAACLDSAIRLS